MKFNGKINRVMLFGRFLGLYDALDKESFKFYMTCLNYVTNVSSFGYIVPTGDQDEITWAPYIRINDFVRHFFELRIPQEEF